MIGERKPTAAILICEEPVAAPPRVSCWPLAGVPSVEKVTDVFDSNRFPADTNTWVERTTTVDPRLIPVRRKTDTWHRPLTVMVGASPPSMPLVGTAKGEDADPSRRLGQALSRHDGIASTWTRMSSRWRFLRDFRALGGLYVEAGCASRRCRGGLRSGHWFRPSRPQLCFQHRGRGAHKGRGEARQRRYSTPFIGSGDLCLKSQWRLLRDLRALRDLCVKTVRAGKHCRGECGSDHGPRRYRPHLHIQRRNGRPTVRPWMTHRPPMSSKRMATP
jgi:hypothetical protein